MFCARITFLQYVENIKLRGYLAPTVVTGGGGETTPCLSIVKHLLITAQNMLIYFRLHDLYLSGMLMPFKPVS